MGSFKAAQSTCQKSNQPKLRTIHLRQRHLSNTFFTGIVDCTDNYWSAWTKVMAKTGIRRKKKKNTLPSEAYKKLHNPSLSISS